MALVLLSGAGIVAIGIVRTGRDQATAQRELREEVERNVRTTARLVAEALTSQEARDRAEQDHRVFAEAGRVILPQWLEALTAAQRMEASAVAQHSEVLGAARRLEFVDGDVGAARKLLTQALQEAPGSGQLVLALAWLEDRAGDKVARDAWIARDEFPRTVPSLLLRARAGSTWPQGDRELLCALEPSEARAVLDRLEEVAPWSVQETDRAAFQEAVTRTEIVRLAARELAARIGSDGPFVARAGEYLVLGTASGERGSAAGFRGQELLDLLAAASKVPFTGQPVLAHAARQDAIVAISGVVAIELPQSVLASTSGPDRMLVLLLVLAGTFVVGGAVAFSALRRESRAMAARAEFLTSVTHELKTPLAGIRLLAEMLEGERVTSPDKQHEYHHRIAAETMRLSTLIENVLDLGRIERGERAYDRRAGDLREIVSEVHALFSVVAERDQMRVELDLDPGVVIARVDRGAIAQALWNLLDNARKYALAGKAVVLTQRGGRIAVRDFGTGVPEKEREAVFAKFTRGTDQRDGSVPGLGLGLHLARAIALAHGGGLVCRAPGDGGAGSEFVLTLPLAEAAR